MPVITRQVQVFKCSRCGHEWIPRKETPAKVCPKCKSPYWDTPRSKELHKAGNVKEMTRTVTNVEKR